MIHVTATFHYQFDYTYHLTAQNSMLLACTCYYRQYLQLFLWLKKKDSVVPVHTMKEYRGSRGITPLILNLGTRWRE
jgi:hypothetical protein